MALILCLETATTMCSVALGKGGLTVAIREVNAGYTHSENLTIFAEQVMKEAGCSFADLDAIAVSKGPGSYTGLRIGVSAAKGFCFALDKPLVAVNTLQALAWEVGDLTLTLSGGEGIKLFGAVSSGEGRDGGDAFGGEGMGEGGGEDEVNMVQEERPRYCTAKQYDWKYLVEYAKNNRKQPTHAESIMWNQLRGKKLGYRFRRQHPVAKYIADFICIEKRLIIEIDGTVHVGREAEDAARTKVLEENGFKVIQFTNDEVISDLDRVIDKIKSILQNPLSHEESSGNVQDPPGYYGHSSRQDLTPSPLTPVLLCPMLDARRMEVYCAFYDLDNNEVRPTSAEIITQDSFSDILSKHKVIFFGDGAAKCKPMLAQQPNAVFIDNVFPSAASLVSLAEEKFNRKELEDVAYFEPYYLKDFVTGSKKADHL